MRYRRVNTPLAKKKVRRRPHAKRIASTGGCFGLTDELWALIEPLLPVHKNPHFLGGGPECRIGGVRKPFSWCCARLPVERAQRDRPLREFHSSRPLSGVGRDGFFLRF